MSKIASALGEAAAQRLASLARPSYEIGPGLTQAELAEVEDRFGFEFADDHRTFLAAGLPVSHPEQAGRGFPDWRDGEPDGLRAQLDWPVEGALFDVEHNVLWQDAWGARPVDLDEALAVAAGHLAEAPRMIPVWGHRYLPGGHGTFGHPVLSMWQTDIIVYGADLDHWVRREFDRAQVDADRRARPTVPFWSQFVE